MAGTIVAIVGSYRRDGVTDRAVEAILDGAREHGAGTQTIYLTERHIEFCRNCRSCTLHPGEERGQCEQKDDMEAILREIDAADGLVLGSPVNCGNVTAIFRRFMERLLCYTYWPWGQPAPKFRNEERRKKAVVVASAAMPGLLVPLMTGTRRALRATARTLGAKTVGSMWIGLAAGNPVVSLKKGQLERLRRLGHRLA
jgi:multimeric flavodoxin WrbA